MNYLQQRLKSFKFAIDGIIAFLRSEPHARIHAAATVVVVAAGCWCKLSGAQWIAVLLVTGLVWITEMLNTVIEKIMDHVSPEYHPQVKWIKDVAAGAVLVAALIALITGCIIFIPLLKG
ncbi:diacylglycerol kinase (ATP) [Chitinophaga sp. CF118]|uniref:diacylglycerol kinase family protein n=1 Tax=Chitinophaga sp. CF118 TaxID=1884367 RepID=UPI0008EE9D2D|nr:diacylglycerol kinase family protein [Chitinophaga sp. CF118]SFD28724.1 diacylglycerol kinase (ATP) [Chitinophaga sp. CF118]